MTRKYPFADANEQLKQKVWEKGETIEENGKKYEPSIWRRDICGSNMKYSEHGNTNSEYGWEIDHIKPISMDGTDDISNLQPLYWENNRRKGDEYPWNC